MADKFMVADALAAGMSPQQISMYVRQNGLVPDTTGVSKWQARKATGDIPHVPTAEVPRQVTTDNGPGLTQQQTNADFGRIIRHEVGPTAASLALTALVPEAGLLKVPGMIARPVAAYLAGTGAEGAAQVMDGGPLNPSAMNDRGLREGGGQLVGEALTGWMPGVAHGQYRDALEPSTAATEASTRTGSRIAGKQIIPQEADLARRGLQERIPLGRIGNGGTSAARLGQLKEKPTADLMAALSEADAAGHTTSIVDIVAQLHTLRDALMRERGGLRKSKVVDKWINELLAQHPNGFTASELSKQKVVWQTQAKAAYKGTATPLVALGARFDAALAKAAKDRLEAIPVPSYANPTQTLGQQIARANLRLSSLKPIEEAANDAEVAITAGKNKGHLLPHFGGPKGFQMPRLDPALSSRLALLLDNPAFRAGVRRAPNVGMAGVGTLDALMNPPQVPFTPAQRDQK